MKREDCTPIELCGVTFYIGASALFDRDFETVAPILEKAQSLTHAERMILLRNYKSSYHDSGKIEGATSCDSSCHGCEFCQKMREAASEDITIICGGCYDHSQEERWLNTENRHKLNMVIMSTVEFDEDELAIIPVSEITRINSSGDIVNETHARNMIKLCLAHPFIKFGFWAKHTAPVIRACDELGKPQNVILIQSSIYINKAAVLQKYFDYTFTVYATEEDLQNALRAGGCECNGKKCADCGWKCYHGAWRKGSNICELYRAPKKQIKKVIEALLQKTA